MKTIISICGPSGSGKSTLAKGLQEKLGAEHAVRLPTDYFLKENIENSVEEYLNKPLEYDWELVRQCLEKDPGTELQTPDFDFVNFKRISGLSGKKFIVRNIVLVDSMIPYPGSDLLIYVCLDDRTRKERIIERDKKWKSNVLSYWDNH